MAVYCFYSIIQVKNNAIKVSQPYRQNMSMSILCDKARALSLECEDCIVSIYKYFIDVPSSTKCLYTFFNGMLVRY